MNLKTMSSKSLLLFLGLCLTGVLFANTQAKHLPKESMITRMERIKEQGKTTGQELSFVNEQLKHLSAPGITTHTNNIEEWLYKSLDNSGFTYIKSTPTYFLVVKEEAAAEPAPTQAGQSAGGTLKGTVLDENGDFLPGVPQ